VGSGDFLPITACIARNKMIFGKYGITGSTGSYIFQDGHKKFQVARYSRTTWKWKRLWLAIVQQQGVYQAPLLK
jgi:hypothetical protein